MLALITTFSGALSSTDHNLRRQFYNLLDQEVASHIRETSIGVIVRNTNEITANKRLEKLIIDLSKSGILKITEFSTRVIDLAQLELVWETEIEFNNSNFNDLFAQSKFNNLLVIDYTSTSTGFEVAFNLYAMDQDQVGSVIASVPATPFFFDWKENEEVEILSASDSRLLNEKIDIVLRKQTIVNNAQTFEQHFANYKLLEARDERLQSLESLVKALIQKPYLVDLVQTATQLSRGYFGPDAHNYLKAELYPYLNQELVKYSRLLLDPNFEIFEECDLDTPRLDQCSITVDNIVFPQLLNLFLKTQGRRFAQNKKNWGAREVREYILLQSARRVIEDFKDGSFSDNYFDKVKASTDVDLSLALDIEAELNTAGYHQIKIQNYVLGSGSEWTLPAVEKITEKGIEKLQFKNIDPSLGSKLLKRRYRTDGLSIYDPVSNSFIPFSDKVTLLDYYFPDSFMPGGSQDVVNFYDISDLGPCEIARGGSVGGSSGDPATYARYFNSFEEKKAFIERRTEAQRVSANDGYPEFDDFGKALEYWNNLPVFEDLEIESTVDIFKVDYPLISGKYLPNSSTTENYYGQSVRKHADFFFEAYSDRLIWADFCILSMMRNAQNNSYIDDYIKLDFLADGTPVFEFSAVSGLYITDSVDVNKPILLNTNNYGENSASWARLDISKDGTLFDPSGLNLDTSQFVRGIGFDVLHSNNWLYVPGIVQSSIGLNEIHEIHYTDIYGNEKTVYPKKGNGRSSGGQKYGGEIDRLGGWYLDDEQVLQPQSYFTNNVEHNLSLFGEMGIVLSLPNYIQKSVDIATLAPLTCYVDGEIAQIANVENYTNFRKRAGLNQPVIGKISLGEVVRLSDPGTYLRTERCASICNSANEQAIKQCIDNNEVWVEVQYNGRRGFLSRKFLE